MSNNNKRPHNFTHRLSGGLCAFTSKETNFRAKYLLNLKTLCLFAFIIFIFLSFSSQKCNAQTSDKEKIKELIEDEKYNDALEIIDELESSKTNFAITESEINYLKGAIYFHLNQFNVAIPLLINGLLYSQALHMESRFEYVENLYGIGYCYFQTEDYKNAEKYLRKAIISVRQLPYGCDIMTDVYSTLSQCYAKMGYEELAVSCLEECIAEIRNQVLLKKQDWRSKIDNEFSLIDSFIAIGYIDKAESIYIGILDTIQENAGRENSDYILYKNLFGNFYQDLYDGTNPDVLIKANGQYEEALEIAKHSPNQLDEIYTIYVYYASSLALLNKEEDVEKLLDDAIAYYSTNNHSETIKYLYLRTGECFYSANNLDKCIELLGKELFARKYFISSDITDISLLVDALYWKNDSRIYYFLDVAYPFMKSQVGINDRNLRLFFEIAMFAYEKYPNNELAIEAGKIALEYCKEEKQPRHHITILTNLISLIYETDSASVGGYFEIADSLLNDPELEETDILYYLSTKSRIYLKSDRCKDAIALLTDVIKKYPLSDSNLSFMSTILHNLGRAYMLNYEYDNALQLLNKSATCQIKSLGTINEKTQQYIQQCEILLSQ